MSIIETAIPVVQGLLGLIMVGAGGAKIIGDYPLWKSVPPAIYLIVGLFVTSFRLLSF